MWDVIICPCPWYLLMAQHWSRYQRQGQENTPGNICGLLLLLPVLYTCFWYSTDTGIKGRDKLLHPTIPAGCNYFSLPLIPAPGTTQKQVSKTGASNYIPQISVGCNYLSLPLIPAYSTTLNRVSKPGTNNYTPQYLQVVIISPCPWYIAPGTTLKQVSKSGASNYIPVISVGCNYLSLPLMPAPASGTILLIHVQ